MRQQPTVTFIIPVRSRSEHCPALDSIKKLAYPEDLIEVLLVAGSNPSAQRNEAAAKAKGDILYFLDNDSILHLRALSTLVDALEDYPEASGIGGPAIPTTATEPQTHSSVK